MHRINVTAEAAEAALVALAEHLPLVVSIGRPLVVTIDDDALVVVTTGGTWWVRAGKVERLAVLPGGRCESAAWSQGVELYRHISG